MCLYAHLVASGDVDAPYTDEAAPSVPADEFRVALAERRVERVRGSVARASSSRRASSASTARRSDASVSPGTSPARRLAHRTAAGSKRWSSCDSISSRIANAPASPTDPSSAAAARTNKRSPARRARWSRLNGDPSLRPASCPTQAANNTARQPRKRASRRDVVDEDPGAEDGDATQGATSRGCRRRGRRPGPGEGCRRARAETAAPWPYRRLVRAHASLCSCRSPAGRFR